jgi:hypothetical protein
VIAAAMRLRDVGARMLREEPRKVFRIIGRFVVGN